MTLKDHLFGFRYNTWANELLFERIASLSEDQLRENLGGSFPTLLETVQHIIAAEWTWLLRWQGDLQPAEPAWIPAASFSDLMEIWEMLEADRGDFLSSLAEKDLDEEVFYIFSSGYSNSSPLGQLFRHIINHSTYHRGQIASMLRQLGVKPPATDMVLFRG